MLETIRWTGSSVRLLEQTRLPDVHYVEITDERQMYDAIKRLVVRGAPAIGVAAGYGAYLGVRNHLDDAPARFLERLNDVCDYLATSRPTAVNLFWALDRMRAVAREMIGPHLTSSPTCQLTRDVADALLDEAHVICNETAESCKRIGENTLNVFSELRGRSPSEKSDSRLNLLTHCNAGVLASVRYGMSLAGVYLGAERGWKFHVYVDETRPLLQGSRITATELSHAGVPATVITDSMAASVMSQKKIGAVIVGADRIASNGDTANKIGTLPLAIVARHFGVPFFVAAPMSTIDWSAPTGAEIPIEEREATEITRWGDRQLAPEAAGVFNPAFDVTPAELITAIVTDGGIAKPVTRETIGALRLRASTLPDHSF